MKRLFAYVGFVALLLATVCPAAETALQPLSVFTDRIKVEKVDPTEIIYVGKRSASLYMCLSSYSENSARDSSDKERAKKLMATAEVFFRVASFLERGDSTKSDEFIKQQVTKFITIYTDSMKEGKMLNNSALTPMILSDMEAAKSVYFIYQALDTDIQEKLKGAK